MATQEGEIKRVTIEIDDGQAFYEVEAEVEGGIVELVFNANGRLVGIEVIEGRDEEDEEMDEEEMEGEEDEDDEEDDEIVAEIAFDQIPAAANASLRKLAGDAAIVSSESITAAEQTVYEAAWMKGDVKLEATVSSTGEIISQEISLTLEQLPKSLREIAKEFAEGAELKIEKKTIVVYEIEAVEDGESSEILVDAAGRQVEIALSELDEEEGDEDEKNEPAAEAESADTTQWRNSFDVKKANLSNVGINPYFILQPGHKLSYKGGDETLVITVLRDTKLVDGVETRVVEEREEKNGKLIEVSRNYFAIDKATKDVYYFGEDVNIYKDGKVVSHDGAWMSGVNGAKFGLMMPGAPKLGDAFYQEHAPEIAMDRCKIADDDLEFKAPKATYKNCLRMEETSAIEAGVGYKIYAPGIGLVKDGDCVIVDVVLAK
jgi:hypothetical protein